MVEQPTGFIGRRLDHPIIGSIVVSFLIWNWPLSVWFVGAVTKPDVAVAGMTSYLTETSFYRLFLWPLVLGSAYAFFAPVAYSWYLYFDELMARWKLAIIGRSKKLYPIDGESFESACAGLEARDKELGTCSKLLIGEPEIILKLSNDLGQVINQYGHPQVVTRWNDMNSRIGQYRDICKQQCVVNDGLRLGNLGPHLRGTANKRRWYQN
jgi:hypothetical protein